MIELREKSVLNRSLQTAAKAKKRFERSQESGFAKVQKSSQYAICVQEDIYGFA